MSLLETSASLSTSPYVPFAVGFMGLGTGYLIYGSQELFGFPERGPKVDFGTGVWGIWLPGLMQLVTGLYLFAGLTLFGTFKAAPDYVAALAFTAYGIHWFTIGWNRMAGADPRANVGMTVGYTLLSALGAISFFEAGDSPVGGLFIGLFFIYVSDFFASAMVQERALVMGGASDAAAAMSRPEPVLVKTQLGELGERALGFFHLGTGAWLMYLMFALVLNLVNGYSLPL
jgi:hypothetical protein